MTVIIVGDPSYNGQNYREQGASVDVIGGTLAILPGASVQVGGVDITSALANLGGGGVAGGSYTADSTDAGAGSKTIATGLSSLASFTVQIFRAGKDVTGGAAIAASGESLVIGTGTGYTLTAGDVINWIAFAG